jgi:SAM-dependent methyltransferase
MIEKARNNADKLGFNNVEFRLGDIENIPLMSNVADVVVSNCVMNLVPNKPKAFCRSSKNFETDWSFFDFGYCFGGDLPEKLKMRQKCMLVVLLRRFKWKNI